LLSRQAWPPRSGAFVANAGGEGTAEAETDRSPPEEQTIAGYSKVDNFH